MPIPPPEFVSTPSIRYGGRVLPLRLPPEVRVDVVGRLDAGSIDESSILDKALSEPVASPRLEQFLQDAKSALVVVNDATRSTPTALMLRAIRPMLQAASNWRVIVATGLHRAPTAAERARLFGSMEEEIWPRLLVHDGSDQRQLSQAARGDESIQINRVVVDADRMVILTSVEPHFFAGFTGGRKSVIPGLAGGRTVEASHAGAVSTASVPLVVGGNPVREFIHRHTQFIDPARVWALQVVLDRRDRIAVAVAGDIDKTFDLACVAAQKYYAVAVPEPYDIVMAVIEPPLDLNLYQAQKGWEHSQHGVRDNGVLIVVSPCREGVGSPFYASLSEQFPDPAGWMGLAERPYTMGLHKLVRTARARERFRLLAVTDMPLDEVVRYGYEPFATVAAALAEALGHVGKKARLLIVESAGLTTLSGDL